MALRYGSDYRITTDSLNVIVQRRGGTKREKKSENETWLDPKYFPTITWGGRKHGLEMAVEWLHAQGVFDPNADDIIDRVVESFKMIRAFMAEYKETICGFMDCRNCYSSLAKDRDRLASEVDHQKARVKELEAELAKATRRRSIGRGK